MKKITVPTKAIPEVQALANAVEELQHFEEEHADVFEQYRQLVEMHNDALAKADTAIRSECLRTNQGISCGPFQFLHATEKVNSDKALATLGIDRFRKVGGTEQTVTQYSLDTPTAKRAIAAELVTQNELRTFFSIVLNFTKPKPIGGL